MKVLLTGGAGFIGSHVVDFLLEEGHQVCVLDALTYAGREDNLSGAKQHASFSFHHGNIGDQALLAHLFKTVQPEAVIHAAAESHVDRSIDDASVFVQTNVEGTYQMLEAARHYYEGLSPQAKTSFRFLHFSTDEVFGAMTAAGEANEQSPYAPRSPYAASKAAADHFVRAYHVTHGLPVLLVHPSNNYGPRQFPEKLLPVVLMNILQKKPIPLYGDGKQEREWLYVEDCVRGVLAVLHHGQIGASYCLGPGNTTTNIDIVHSLCGWMDRLRPDPAGPYTRLIHAVQDRPGHDRRYCLDTTKVRKTLGWSPHVSLEEGLEKTVRWYLDHHAFLTGPHKRLGLRHGMH